MKPGDVVVVRAGATIERQVPGGPKGTRPKTEPRWVQDVTKVRTRVTIKERDGTEILWESRRYLKSTHVENVEEVVHGPQPQAVVSGVRGGQGGGP